MKTSIAATIGLLTVLLAFIIAFKFINMDAKIVPFEEPKIQITEPPPTTPPQVKIPDTPPKIDSRIEIKPEPIRKLPRSYQEAISYAKSRNAKILVIFMSRSCTACDQMRATFTNEGVRQSLANIGVCVLYYIDANGSESNVAKRYGVTAVPAYCVIDSDEKMYLSGIGYKDVTTFTSWVRGEIQDQ